jgi:hypothetical protein
LVWHAGEPADDGAEPPAKTKHSLETILLRRITWVVWQVNLLTTVLNDSPVLPEEDDTPSMYRAIKEKDFNGNNNFWMLLFSNGKSSVPVCTFFLGFFVP